MKLSRIRVLSALLAACLVLILAPAALTEAAGEVAAEPVDTAVAPDEAAGLGGDEAAPPEALLEAGAIGIDAVSFPDPVFRQYVLARFDADGDGALSQAEADAVRVIEVNEMGVADLTGIGFFPNLMLLNCRRNALTALDVRGNAALATLFCGYNQLTALDVSGHAALTHLDCDKNRLSSLDVGGCVALKHLDCGGNALTALNVADAAPLEYLLCSDNQLAALVLGSHPALTDIACQSNQLTALDLGGCPKLAYLSCGFNRLSALDLSGGANLKKLDCQENRMAALDLVPCPRVTRYVDGAHYVLSGSAATYSDDYGEAVLVCDATVSITGGDPVPARLAKHTISVNKNTAYTATAGETYQIDPAGRGYKSSRKSVAAVDQNGVITAKAAGKAKITFKVGKKKRTLTLTVEDPTIPDAVYLDQTDTVTLKKGDTFRLSAAIPEGAVSDIRWSSGNRRVAVVSQDGTVTGKKPGKTTITATAVRGGKKARVKIKVTK